MRLIRALIAKDMVPGIVILTAGIALRLIVFNDLSPMGSDNHYEVIQSIARNHALPHADQFNQSYHPPLYHLLAALVMPLGQAKAVHLLSLIFSLAALILAHGLISRLRWISRRNKPWCQALVTLHPQFIAFGLFISNDTLAALIGVVIFGLCARIVDHPNWKHHLALAVALGLGLLTKHTFLAFFPPLLLMILIINHRSRDAHRTQWARLACFTLVAGLLGCYKYVENMIYLGQPFISNLDLGWFWMREQFMARGSGAFLDDFNLLRLLSEPSISPAITNAPPLMLYGTFWHSCVPNANFLACLDYPIVARAIYVAALVPTLTIMAGTLRSVILMMPGMGGRAPNGESGGRRMITGIAGLVLLMNLGLIVYVGEQYRVSSVFQGRLLFPSYFAILLMLNAGLESAAPWKPLERLIKLSLLILFVLFVGSLILEIVREWNC